MWRCLHSKNGMFTAVLRDFHNAITENFLLEIKLIMAFKILIKYSANYVVDCATVYHQSKINFSSLLILFFM